MTVNKPCKITDVNPKVTVIREPSIASQCPSLYRTQIHEVLTLCDVVNRAEVGAEHFVGNKVGQFKLVIFFRASVVEFFIEGFSNQTHITFYDTNQLTIWCRGDGHPAPEMQLLKTGFQYSRGKSPIRYTMTTNGSRDTGIYTCIASNALGKDSKEIEINVHIDTELHQGEADKTNKQDDKQSTVFIVGVCSTVAGSLVLLTLSLWLLKRGYTCVSLVRILRSSAIVESNNDINANSAHSDLNTGTNYAFFEGRFPDDETHSSGVINVHTSSIEIAEMSHAFDNETYAESINKFEEGPINNHWPGQDQAPGFCRLKCSTDDPKDSCELGAIDANDDDSLRNGVIAADFALSVQKTPNAVLSLRRNDYTTPQLTDKLQRQNQTIALRMLSIHHR
ncbi:uncharacterized protein LOC127858869 isoform X2 [Dreissena polymorpha]|uniref:uncharacterized protein LOC127858869 isoform X2 n=1 Tax=Dreissena polymorpha TaxID=45954 RepID=UPI0022655E6E|nr:uncharacterized protein LOC127858869 isoform X2 [Dreissena polymorpha]